MYKIKDVTEFLFLLNSKYPIDTSKKSPWRLQRDEKDERVIESNEKAMKGDGKEEKGDRKRWKRDARKEVKGLERFCGALRWKDESSGMCCSNGKVRLPLIDLPPEPLRSLLSGENSDSVHFLRNIRKYNSCFQMTSSGAENQTHSVTFPTTFSIQGQVYHRIGSLMPSENQPQTDRRCQQIQGVRRNIVQGLQRMLHQHNLLVQQFKTALENLPSDAYRVVVNADRTPPGQHPRWYNAPTANEVAVVLAGDAHLKIIGLLENDNHWVVTMDEAVLCQAHTRVRQLFAILISTCTISNPQQLWITYRDEMASDILLRYQLLDSSIRYNDLIYNETLCNIEDRVVSICGKKLQEIGLGAPRRNVVTNSDILRELAYDTAELEDNVASMMPKLLPEQRRVFDAVLEKNNLSQLIIIFLDAPGGKTFLLNLLLAMVRKEQNIAIAVASSGIAATLLAGGRTSHSVLKLPMTFAEGQTAVCNWLFSKGRGPYS
ncbi:hypothetical protein LAZ67_1003546 [Cordylochernes scorpioides]|uniref:ATP-dependent DNA helicase n=1 Tax=Cordylochernes scorpioides TaxID=51811 RepID=A0ABY6JWX4_9ARAC|nr:hypothetical protein LAZ67_1003546 [Cordylochernes scorpioides]